MNNRWTRCSVCVCLHLWLWWSWSRVIAWKCPVDMLQIAPSDSRKSKIRSCILSGIGRNYNLLSALIHSLGVRKCADQLRYINHLRPNLRSGPPPGKTERGPDTNTCQILAKKPDSSFFVIGQKPMPPIYLLWLAIDWRVSRDVCQAPTINNK